MEKTQHRPPPTQVAIVPCSGMGHLIPVAQLAKRLCSDHLNLSVTIIVPMISPATPTDKSILAGLPPSVTSIFLPPPDLADLAPHDRKVETLASLVAVRSIPSMREALRSVVVSSGGSRIAAVVSDPFCVDCSSVVAREFGAAFYVFFPTAAMTVSLFLHLPELDEAVPGDREFRELEELVGIPGCVPIPGGELLDLVQDRKSDAYKWVLHLARTCLLADGIMVNSFSELEGGVLAALQEEGRKQPMVYPVGPLVDTGEGPCGVGEPECLRWLDDQPRGSVVYVSFGSRGTLSREQLTELALGLEMSEQRFIWRPAADAGRSGGSGFLPEGFVDRTKNRGLVVMDSLIPQAQVLSHGSTGGFVTHCGWNSVLESVVNGVPLIAWPLCADQSMNAFMLVEDVKVAIRPISSSSVSALNIEKNIIGRTEISAALKKLMEGEQGKTLRRKMNNLKDAAIRSLLGEEDAISTKIIAQVAANWKQQATSI